MAKAQGVDQNRKVLLTNHGEIPYDYLVLSAGATTNFFGMDRVEKNSFGMKTLQEAIHIRNHVLHMFERADKREDDETERRRMLTFVVVGGGPTGIAAAIPSGFGGFIFARSGLGIKRGITPGNCVGVIDSDYRGEIMVLLVNLSNAEFTVNDGERIAQMVIARHEQGEFLVVSELDETERGEGGYGHTGVS